MPTYDPYNPSPISKTTYSCGNSPWAGDIVSCVASASGLRVHEFYTVKVVDPDVTQTFVTLEGSSLSGWHPGRFKLVHRASGGVNPIGYNSYDIPALGDTVILNGVHSKLYTVTKITERSHVYLLDLQGFDGKWESDRFNLFRRANSATVSHNQVSSTAVAIPQRDKVAMKLTKLMSKVSDKAVRDVIHEVAAELGLKYDVIFKDN